MQSVARDVADNVSHPRRLDPTMELITYSFVLYLQHGCHDVKCKPSIVYGLLIENLYNRINHKLHVYLVISTYMEALFAVIFAYRTYDPVKFNDTLPLELRLRNQSCVQYGIVQNMDWKIGLDSWTGQLDWTVGLDNWNGQLDWTIGLDFECNFFH